MPSDDRISCPVYLDMVCRESEPWVRDTDALRYQAREMVGALTKLPGSLSDGISVFADALSISCYLPLSSACDLLTGLPRDMSFDYLLQEVSRKGDQEGAEVLLARARTLCALGYFERVYDSKNRAFLKEALANLV